MSTWSFVDSVIIGKYNALTESTRVITKVAAFDIDGTIIKTKSGNIFANNETDWKFFDKSVPNKLVELYEDGYQIIFISNQLGISKGKINIDEWKKKIDSVCVKIGCPIEIYAATDNNFYRKPMTGIWDEYVCYNTNNNTNNDELKTSSKYEKCFFVGDAAGRKKDFSDTDRKFALNLDIPFYTPEMFFLETPNNYINYPIDYFNNLFSNKLFNNKNTVLSSDYIIYTTQTLIINVGYMASGKTTYTKDFLKHQYINGKGEDFVYINQDLLKTAKKCIKDCETALKNKKSVIIDNTNPSVNVRKEYIDLAKKYKVTNVICNYFNTDIEHSMHNMLYRHVITNGKSKIIPDMVFYMFRKRFVMPELSEGFSHINTIPFTILFKSDKDFRTYMRYYK
jgi:bifunctional polynucleotide phosphatase/kinase